MVTRGGYPADEELVETLSCTHYSVLGLEPCECITHRKSEKKIAAHGRVLLVSDKHRSSTWLCLHQEILSLTSIGPRLGFASTRKFRVGMSRTCVGARTHGSHLRYNDPPPVHTGKFNYLEQLQTQESAMRAS